MDTGTHFAMGVAISGMATLDPAVANDPNLFQAVLIGSVVGSQAPDFDTVLKFRNNATFIRHHRGLNHSIPAVIFWGITIASALYLFYPNVNFLHLWLWIFLAVMLHVFVDLFNAYGTQALRPFSNKWIAFGLINTFDPFIFILHVVGTLIWVLGGHPGYTWLLIYCILTVYYVKRFIDKRAFVKQIYTQIPDVIEVVTSPTWKYHHWKVAVTTKHQFLVGTVMNGHFDIIDTFKRVPLPDDPMMNVAKTDKNISAFLSFSPVYYWEKKVHKDYTEIRFIDLRYRSKEQYTFVAVVYIDRHLNILSSYTGWVFSEQKLKQKLSFSNHLI